MTELLDRRRLLAMIGQNPGLWIVEACAGSGKTTFARQLARSYGSSVQTRFACDRDSDPNPTAKALIVDCSDPWEPTPAERNALGDRAHDAITVVLARRISDEAREACTDLGARWIRTADIWFDDDELIDLATLRLGDVEGKKLGTGLRSLTDGWPSAAAACVDESSRATGPFDLATALRTAFAAVFEPPLASLPPDSRRQLEILSFFERFDRPMVNILGDPDLISTLLDGGLPLLDDGRWHSLGVVARSVVRNLLCGFPEVGAEPFEYLAHYGYVTAAVETAIEVGRPDIAVAILSSLTAAEAHALDPARAGVVWARLGATLDTSPRTYLVRARQKLAVGDVTAAIELLEHGLATINEAASADAVSSNVMEETQAELAFAFYLSGDLDRARAHLPACDFSFGLARARQYEVIAGLDALTMQPDALDRAAENFAIAERLWAENGEMILAGVVLTALAMEVTSRVGKLEEAIILLDRNLATAAADPRRHTTTQVARIRLLALAGRHDEAEAAIREIQGLVDAGSQSWMLAHINQARAIIASHRGDLAAVHQLIALAADDLGDLAHHAPGALLHIDALDAYARCGQAQQVAEHLEALRSHSSAEGPDVAWAEVVAACRVGDATRGLELAAKFRFGDVVVPEGEWKLDFAESVALGRLGRADEAAAKRTAAQTLAASVGTSRIIDLTETRLPPETAAATTVEPQGPRVQIHLFPDFAIDVAGTPVDLPRGHMRTVLKLLTLASGKITVDEIVEVLWPNGEPQVGRRRLRNVVSRLRTACDDAVVRDGDMLYLADHVDRPYRRWWEASAAALERDAADLEALAGLVDAAPNVLLLADRYEEWLQPWQRRYQVQLLQMIDLLASASAKAGQIDRAVEAYRRGFEIDPWADERLDTAIDLLREAGRNSAVTSLERLRNAQ